MLHESPKQGERAIVGLLSGSEMTHLVTLVEEAARSTKEGIKHFVEPAPGTLRRATSRRHHIIFGRRGSGKSSLLHKAASDLTIDRRPIAHVNLEAFKGHSYPDVLLSVLISTLKEFKKWMETAAVHPSTRKSFWETLFGTTPTRPAYARKKSEILSKALEAEIDKLESELHQTDAADMVVKSGAEESEKAYVDAEAKASIPVSSVKAKAQAEFTKKDAQEIEQKYKRSKIDFLHRHILDYQQIFRDISELSGGDAYLFLDDLYHIRRADQANVVDYFHRIAKDHNLWVKIGTIRHRTRWYIHGDPPIGMKVGDDADEIDLDLTLEKYKLAKEFLVRVLTNFAEEAKIIPISSFLTDGALDRLVLASGGVARDFLSIFRRSKDVACERGGGHRGEKVGAEDVNVAAGENDSYKREEFKRDTLDDNITLENEFQKLRDFCLDKNNTNCFLLNKDRHGPEVDLIHELVDLKFIHLARSRVTVRGHSGQIFEAYMLDLSQYAGARKRRKLKIVEFWKKSSKDALRGQSLIFSPNLSSDTQHPLSYKNRGRSSNS